MKSIRNVSVILSGLAAILLVGCGGGGSGSGSSTPVSTTTATPSVSVDWPTRTRNFSGPSSALSVSFTLQSTSSPTTTVTIVGDRSSNLAAHTDTFAATKTCPTGQYLVSATFYASAGETGAVVGTASADVDVSASGQLTTLDGTTLGAITFTGVITKAVVTSGQTVTYGATTTLTATAYNSSNDIVVITPGSYTFAIASGSSYLTLAADGDAVGVSQGTATVTATVDGVTSAAASVSVVPAQVSISQTAYAFAYDSTRSVLYAAISPGLNGAAASIVQLNPTTGAVQQSLALSSAPVFMTESTDGTHLYVLSSSQVISQIDLSAFTVLQTFSLPAGSQGTQLLTIPSGNDTWAVATQNGSTTAPEATIIYDGVTARANTAVLGQSIAVNAAGTQIYGYQKYVASGNRYTVATISSDGIDGATSVTSALSGPLNEIHYLNGLIVADDGTIINPTTGATVRTLSIPTSLHIAAVGQNQDRVYVAGNTPDEILCYSLSTGSLVYTYALTGVGSADLDSPTVLGSGSLAVRTNAASPNSIQLILGLP